MIKKKYLIKYIEILFLLILFSNCKSNINQTDILDGSWNLIILKEKDKYLLDGSQFIYGNYLEIDNKHHKFQIELYDNIKVKGDFKIITNNFKRILTIYKSSDSIYNGKYKLILDTVFENELSIHYRLLVNSNKVSFLAKKIAIKKR